MKNLLSLFALITLIGFLTSCNQEDLSNDLLEMENIESSTQVAEFNENQVEKTVELSKDSKVESEIEERSGWVKVYEDVYELGHDFWYKVKFNKHHLDTHCKYIMKVTPYHGNADAYIHGKNHHGYRLIRYSNNHHGYDETYAYYNDLRHDEDYMSFNVHAKTACKFKIQIFKECEQNNDCATVEFEKPYTHQEICKGEDLYVKVKAYGQHDIKYVKLYVNGHFVRQENTAPYEWGKPHAEHDDWLNHMQPGHYELKAVAEDYYGCKTTKTFNITVKDCHNGGGHHGPEVHFENLYDGKRYHRHTDLYVKVKAEDYDGVDYVKLYVNGHFVRQENSAPYEWGRPHAQNDHWLNNMQHGTYHIKAVAKDRHGNETSKTVTIYID